MGTTRLSRHIRAPRSVVYRSLLDADDAVPGEPEVVAEVAMYSTSGLGAPFESAPANLTIPDCTDAPPAPG